MMQSECVNVSFYNTTLSMPYACLACHICIPVCKNRCGVETSCCKIDYHGI